MFPHDSNSMHFKRKRVLNLDSHVALDVGKKLQRGSPTAPVNCRRNVHSVQYVRILGIPEAFFSFFLLSRQSHKKRQESVPNSVQHTRRPEAHRRIVKISANSYCITALLLTATRAVLPFYGAPDSRQSTFFIQRNLVETGNLISFAKSICA